MGTTSEPSTDAPVAGRESRAGGQGSPTVPPTADAARFCEVRSHTESLAAPLSPEDQVVQSMTDASPVKWHRAHTTWFFEEFVLGPGVAGYQVVDPSYRFLFNSYYEAVGARQPRPRRGMITRPSVDEVGEFRRRVDGAVASALEAGALGADALELVELGLHHEQQHQELLLMDVKHLLWQNPLRPAYRAAAAAPPPGGTDGSAGSPPQGWVALEGGILPVGHEGPGFAYDNEGPRHDELVRPFRLADRLVTNGEWLEFLADDGYRRPELWLSDGWATVQAEGWDAPLYWDQDEDGAWQAFTLSGMQPVDPSAPVVHVSGYEADAYARWRGLRLPTEVEWEVAVAALGSEDRSTGEPAPHPRTVPAAEPGRLRQAFGEVWQWTASQYTAYPGFRPAEGAVGEYNGKFMCDQHVLRGSCCATPPGHERVTYRNFFPARSRWAFSGVRVADDA